MATAKKIQAVVPDTTVPRHRITVEFTPLDDEFDMNWRDNLESLVNDIRYALEYSSHTDFELTVTRQDWTTVTV